MHGVVQCSSRDCCGKVNTVRHNIQLVISVEKKKHSAVQYSSRNCYRKESTMQFRNCKHSATAVERKEKTTFLGIMQNKRFQLR